MVACEAGRTSNSSRVCVLDGPRWRVLPWIMCPRAKLTAACTSSHRCAVQALAHAGVCGE
eukprot:5237972-Prymnesium_polylepis.1